MRLIPNEPNRDTSVQVRLVSVREAARLLGIGITKTYELIADGLLDTVTFGSRRLVTLRSIDALIDGAANG
ncbi:helix-turn-helix domain-containing protein [Brevundimonas sp.]|uniref:helix-turn-helix domain-containing protein n=1 Tax=Brevundimonas sp. TaxID=1871086 RepID=UPI00262B1B86|nr:helix-turn-helix domain-containing protein [Brevundimonas sp.]